MQIHLKIGCVDWMIDLADGNDNLLLSKRTVFSPPRPMPRPADLTFRPEAESFDQFNVRYQSAVFDAVFGKVVA